MERWKIIVLVAVIFSFAGIGSMSFAQTCLMTMDDNDEQSGLTLADNPIYVSAPNGGEIIPSGSTYTIQWEAPLDAVRFKLMYSMNNGLTWYLIDNNVIGTTSYDWTVAIPKGTKTKCLVRVVGYDASNVEIGKDRSDTPFTIEVLKLTSPDGGEAWTSGSQHVITWTTHATVRPVGMVQLYYTKDGGVTWHRIAELRENTGSYDWLVPNVSREKSKCKVKVVLRCCIKGKFAKLELDVSDGYFTITPSVAPSL